MIGTKVMSDRYKGDVCMCTKVMCDRYKGDV